MRHQAACLREHLKVRGNPSEESETTSFHSQKQFCKSGSGLPFACVFCSVLTYPDREETENELSLVIRHAINCFVSIFDLVDLSNLLATTKNGIRTG